MTILVAKGTTLHRPRSAWAGGEHLRHLRHPSLEELRLRDVTDTRPPARYKQNIEALGDTSTAVLSLRPVSFHYRQATADGSKPQQFGLIAEEVAEVLPELVVYDETGRPETVKYHLLSILLLNELQKQSEQLQDLTARLAAVEARPAAPDWPRLAL